MSHREFLYALSTVLSMELSSYHRQLVNISGMTTDPLIKTEIDRLASSMQELATAAKEELATVKEE